MKIWHISDTHGVHNFLTIPQDIDIVIHSGDCSNHQSPVLNENEVKDFLRWFSMLPIKHKIFVAGNHDTSIEARYISPNYIRSLGIKYLENQSCEIDGIHFFGTPITPTFGTGWAWNKKREKMHDLWESVPENIDVLISHGPPKGILDLSYDRENNLECCGCTSMFKFVSKSNFKLVLFGHIHNSREIHTNAGTMQLAGKKTIFSNGTVVRDGQLGQVYSNGNILTI